MKWLDFSSRLRINALPGLPLWIFLLSYFGLTVLGNLLYATPFGSDLPAVNIVGFSWDNVNGEFSPGFWMLVLLPFALSPLAFVVKKLASPLANASVPLVPEISKRAYILLTAALYAYAIYKIVEVHALARFLAAGGAIAAVENRFALLADIGFKPQVVLKSLLVFLSVYGAVRAARENGWFWPAVTTLNTVVLTACLILLNMKWPPVVFIITLGICVFVASERHPFAKSFAVLIAGGLLYMTLAVVVLRWFPADEIARPHYDISNSIAPSGGITSEQPIEKHAPLTIGNTVDGTISFAPRILVGALNRMAMAVPFYYDFSGPCSSSLLRLWVKRDLSCEPALIVYTRLFGNDGFAGRGTAPAAMNLYGYALDGWPGAIICTVIAMFVIGLFMSIWKPAQSNSVFAAAFVMGCYTAYFFSQLPVEGPLIYDHGLWWVFLVLAWAGYAMFRSFQAAGSRSPASRLKRLTMPTSR